MMFLAVTVTTLLWVGVVEGNPGVSNTTHCPSLITIFLDGKCVYVNQVVEDKVTAELNKRQIVIPKQVCPYCASGVYDAYPDWGDCTQFNYCLNGIVIPLKCRDLGGVVFNPMLKACEMFQSTNNICTNRAVDLNTVLA